MSQDIYVLTEFDDSTHGRYDMLCWFESQEEADAEALTREWAHYHARVAEMKQPLVHIASPDEAGLQRYSVRVVPKA